MGQDIILALKGWEGWGDQRSAHLRWSTSISLGAKVRKGVKVWPVGRWSLKAAFYADVRKEGLSSGKEADPPGYCHFPTGSTRPISGRSRLNI